MFGAETSADRLAIEVQFELYAEHAILVGAGVVIHVTTVRTSPGRGVGELPDFAP